MSSKRKFNCNLIDDPCPSSNMLDERPFFTPCQSPSSDNAAIQPAAPTRPSNFANKLSCCSQMDRRQNITVLDKEAERHDSEEDDTEQQSFSPQPMHNWQEEQAAQKEFFDDGTMTYFW